MIKKTRFYVVFVLINLICGTLFLNPVLAQVENLNTEADQPATVTQNQANILSTQTVDSQVVEKDASSDSCPWMFDISKKLIQTILIILVGYVIIILFVGIINRRVKDIKARHLVRKKAIYFFTFVIIVVTFFVWIQKLDNFTIFIGVAGAGLALALQEALLCIAGWLLILLRRPFEVGDRIELGGVKGDVIDIHLFQTSMLEMGNWVDADQSTGRIVNVPNSAIFKKENYNYSHGFEFIWNEIKLLLTYESDWKRGEEIALFHANKYAEGMEEIVKKKIEHMTSRYMIYHGKLTPIVYVNVKDSGVELTIRYLTEAKKRRVSHDMLCRSILDDFAKESKIDFAYPTYRIIK